MCRRWGFVAVLVLTFVLAGCGAIAAAKTNNVVTSNASSNTLPTSLIVTRTGKPYDHIPPFQGGSTDATAVQHLYHEMFTLKPVQGSVYSCPADFGIVYTLIFLKGNTQILEVTANASGCEWLHLGANGNRWTTDAFWSLLAQTVGIPATDIHPVP